MGEFFGSLFSFLLFVVIAGGVILIMIYNSLQALGQRVKSANANIVAVLQKRADLINKLMDVAKEYGNHEKLVHIEVSHNLRDMVSSTNNAMMNIQAFSQAFPELKADTAYRSLMDSMETVEGQLQQKREEYNYSVEAYNTKRTVFPAVLFAGMLGFNEAPYLDFDNMQTVRDFKTDDGQMLKEMLRKGGEQIVRTTAQATAQATDLTKKGFKMAKDSIDTMNSRKESGMGSVAEDSPSSSSSDLHDENSIQ